MRNEESVVLRISGGEILASRKKKAKKILWGVFIILFVIALAELFQFLEPK